MKPIAVMKSDFPIMFTQNKVIKLPKQYTMHSAMSKFLLLPQFFGIFPLYGVTNKDIRSIKFTWLSLRALYAIYCIIGGSFMTVLCLIRFSIHGLMLDKTGKYIL